MNKLYSPKIVAIILTTLILTTSCGSALFSRFHTRGVERHMAGSKRSSPKVRESPKVVRAKKTQEKKQEKLDRDYDKYVKESRKRSYEIQSEDVKTRMKNNEAGIKEREKAKGKRERNATRKAGRKYN